MVCSWLLSGNKCHKFLVEKFYVISEESGLTVIDDLFKNGGVYLSR